MDKTDIVALTVALLVWAVPLALFYMLHIPPTAKIPTHWGVNGKPNGWTNAKDFPALILVMAAITFVVWGVRYVYPRQRNVKTFARAYNAFVIGVSTILALIMSAAVLQAAGCQINASAVATAGGGALLAIAGVVTFVSKQNWAMGVRTPWGLESERAWVVSNKIGGASLITGGILIALDGLGTNTALLGLVVTLGGVVLASAAAYVAWRREQ